jgi:hypothetical protein
VYSHIHTARHHWIVRWARNCGGLVTRRPFSDTWRNTICWLSVRALQDSGRRYPR